MFLNPAFIAFVAALATLFLWLGITRPQKETFEEEMRSRGLHGKIAARLLRAGLTETDPMLIITGTTVAMTGALFFVALIAHSPFAGIGAALAVPVLIAVWLNRQHRKFRDRINAALVPFLRQMEANVAAQQNASQAFRYAVEKSPILRTTLHDKMNELRLNRPFAEVLLETREIIPVRGWVQFVKAMEIQVESGGNLADTLKNAVRKIQSRLLLQETIRGKYRSVAGQQKVILGAGIGIPIFFYFSAPAVFGNLFKNPIGIAGLILGIALIITGILIGRSTVKDIEGKINY